MKILLLIFPLLCFAKYTEYKKGSRVYYIYDSVKDESYFPEEAPSDYSVKKSLGQVKEKEMKISDYHLNPRNLKFKKLKEKLKNRDLNLIEINEYLRLDNGR